MRLRKYLVKRVIHMIITLIIVLVLLFVLFRLMPGDAAQNLFMKPGITQMEKDLISVKYGFGKWVEEGGDHFEYTFSPEEIGYYSLHITAEDESGTDTLDTHFNVNFNAASDYVPPDIVNIDVMAGTGDSMVIGLDINDDSALRSVGATLLHPDFTTDNIILTEAVSHDRNTTVYNVVAGAYAATFTVEDGFGNIATAYYMFDVITDVNGNVTNTTAGLKIWNFGTDATQLNIHYEDAVIPVHVQVQGNTGAPALRVTQPGMTNLTDIALTSYPADWYNTTSFTADANGIFGLTVIVDGQMIRTSVPVNSNEVAQPTPPADNAAPPTFADLVIARELDDGSISTEYPFILTDTGVKVFINVSVSNADGERIAGFVNATITTPSGEIVTFPMQHPQHVIPRSMLEQFGIYMKNMLVFDFGESFEDNRPVWDVMIERIPATLLLFGSSLILSYVIGILIGVIVAWRRGSVLELSTIVVTLFFYSMPIFWSALIAQWIFFAQLGWFPLSGFGGVDPATGTAFTGFSYFIDVLWHLALPLITLTVLHLAGTILLMRSSMLEVMGEDFITTARAKGLKQRTVVYKHAARNAMLPVVTSMALALGSVISGGVLTETIFSWPGMGTLLIVGTLKHNYPVVQGAFYILAMMTIVGNMMADILYAYLDPRVQL